MRGGGLKLILHFLTAAAFVSTCQCAENKLTKQEKKEGWILLFDGSTLDGWMSADGRPSKRPVEDNSINPHASGTDVLVYKKPVENFILSTDFKIAPRCNSGIMLRNYPLEKGGKDYGWNAIEVQIEDTPGNNLHTTGAFYDLIAPAKNAMKPAGEWNHIVINCNRNIVTINLNGEDINRMDLDLFSQPGMRPDGTRHKFGRAFKDQPRLGYIGLQDHGGECWYKNIKLKALP